MPFPGRHGQNPHSPVGRGMLRSEASDSDPESRWCFAGSQSPAAPVTDRPSSQLSAPPSRVPPQPGESRYSSAAHLSLEGAGDTLRREGRALGPAAEPSTGSWTVGAAAARGWARRRDGGTRDALSPCPVCRLSLCWAVISRTLVPGSFHHGAEIYWAPLFNQEMSP